MTHDRIILLTLQAQARMFRLAKRDHGLSLKCISLDSGLPYETVRSYAGEKGAQSMMPISAVNKLTGVIPDNLLSHLFEPGDRQLVADDDIDDCLDDLGDEAGKLEAEVRRARHPASPGGTDIIDIEQARIRRAATRMSKRAKKVASA
jgi:hypothetical protein